MNKIRHNKYPARYNEMNTLLNLFYIYIKQLHTH